MIGKVTALLKTKRWFKRPRLDQISTSVDACAIVGEEGLCGVSINKSAVDFESIFEIEKRFKK